MAKFNKLVFVSALFALLLAGCGQSNTSSETKSSETPTQSSETPAPSSETPAPSSQTPAPSSQTPAPSSQTQITSSKAPTTSSQKPASSSQTPASSSQTPASSSAQDETAYAMTGIDIIEESSKVYLKLSGTISGYANANAMKFAFGLVSQGTTPTWITGKENPEDADYTIAPVVTGDAFEAKLDVTNVQFSGAIYDIYAGPKGHYSKFNLTNQGIGTGAAKVNGCRLYMRADLGALAADELPPLEMTISKLEVVGDKIYHLIGGALNTAKLSANDFLAKHPYVNYEGCPQWSKNVLGDSKNTNLVSTEIDAQGNGLVRIDITSLKVGGYQVKVNLNGDSDVNTPMDVKIDTSANPVAFGMYDYILFADNTLSGADNFYGNCGIKIVQANRYVNAGDKVADLQPVKSKDGEVAYELYPDSTNTPNLPADKKMKNLVSTFNITGVAAGEYEVYIKAHVSSGNENANVGFSFGEQLNGKPGRYYVQTNDGDLVYTDTGEKLYKDVGIGTSTEFVWTNCPVVPSVMFGNDAVSFKFGHSGAGYSIYLEAIRLIKIGTYMAPAKNVVFDNHEMLIEAEDYSLKHTIITNSGAETNYTTDGTTYPVNLDGKVVEDATASNGKYVHEIFREGWNGSSNMSGELVFRINVASDTSVKIKAKIKSDMETEKVCFDLKLDGQGKGSLNAANTWVEVESQLLTLTAGIHTISFVGQQLGSSEGYRSVLADIDCFTLVEQVQ